MTIVLIFAGLMALTLIAPNAVSATDISPRRGVRLWTCVLTLRAVIACALALIAVFYLPATELFGLLTHWCLHAVLPFFAQHLGFDGHYLGDAAALVPSLVISALLVSAGFGLLRATRATRSVLRGNAIGSGPRRSTIIAGPEIVVAAAGVRDPRVVVSAGALLKLDEDELAAGLEHEWGHVANRHAQRLAFAQLCLAMSRFLPGGRAALRELRFQLEREADEYSVQRTGDALALAAAITKAAGAVPAARQSVPMPLLGGTERVADRIRLLLGGAGRPSGGASAIVRGLTGLTAVLALILALSLPLLVVEAPAAGAAWHGAHDCPS
jgi:hypothetical protein